MNITQLEFDTLRTAFELLCRLQDRAEESGELERMYFINDLRHGLDTIRYSSTITD